MASSNTIHVVGAGIAGLGAALAFQRRGWAVVLLDRDGEPPSDDPTEAFEHWRRPGVLHLRQSHVFLGRLVRQLRADYPALYTELLDAGCRELRFPDGLPPHLRTRYRPAPGDEDMTFLSSRRTTLELVMRSHVARLPGVEIRTGARVTGVDLDGGDDDTPAVSALRVETEGGEERLEVDRVVDASGRRTPFPDWLATLGVTSHLDTENSEILYFTRHYRLLEGRQEPEPGDVPANGDLVFLKFGVFPGDNGCFSVTIALPAGEATLRRGVMDGARFDRICSMLPGLARWTDPERAEPTSQVWGMGGLVSEWRRFRERGRATVLGYFPIGDAAIRSNPMYGRGCSAGILEAHLLADCLAATDDPRRQIDAFEAALERHLRDYFDDMRQQDRQSIRRVTRYYEGDGPAPTLRRRLARSFVEDGVIPATRASVPVLRGALRSLHMLEPPRKVFSDPRLLGRILAIWALPRALKRRWYPPRPGPDRDTFLRELDLTDPA